jgi:hypothetical protein
MMLLLLLLLMWLRMVHLSILLRKHFVGFETKAQIRGTTEGVRQMRVGVDKVASSSHRADLQSIN